ncbi:hypothetical protein B0H10DRAFT_2186913 [Mycena sp. CBHHK59/15]|nr:hypothetical protein B0H10DRAFT_2186913 [Mycena sp. CBHHK59/15]
MDTHPPFVLGDWIGQGINYDSDKLPYEVLEAYINAVDVLPTYTSKLTPPGEMPVEEFLDVKLPKQSSALALGESRLWFSKDPPKPDSWAVLQDVTRGIPPLAVLSLLRRKIPQKWMDGYQSISDPRFNDGADRLSLWTLTLWEKMVKTVHDRSLWDRSIEWMGTAEKKCRDEDTKTAIKEAREVIKTMGWNEPLPFLKSASNLLRTMQLASRRCREGWTSIRRRWFSSASVEKKAPPRRRMRMSSLLYLLFYVRLGGKSTWEGMQGVP